MVSSEVYQREKRGSKRKIVKMDAILNYQGADYPGIVENISEGGLYMILSDRNMIDLTPSRIHKLTLLSGNRRLGLSCRVIWSYPTPPYGLTTSVGMEIVNPSQEFIEYLKEMD